MKFTEDTRVKIPTILHLVGLGYEYLSLKNQKWDLETNIFPEIFNQAIHKINPSLKQSDIKRQMEKVKLALDNEDLGREFYNLIVDQSGIKLIDLENIDNNTFHVVTELTYKNGDEEFRPDIISLINGMPLVFIEVKKPNNREGVIAEQERINSRFQNRKFRRFVNVTQFMIFSNNMEYDDADVRPIQGAFYASPSYHKPMFNYFREEEKFDLSALLKPLSDDLEIEILKDNNLGAIRSSPEFITNKNPDSPTNRICTSLLSRERLAFMLRYSLAYVYEDGLQKHIMRYPQLFATKAIEQKLNEGIKKGIIWHTQGSGKTALAYYNVKFLTDYFQKKQIIPKFYFIVDRIDLLNQAKKEFTGRGLTVHIVESREEFAKAIKTIQVIHNHSGKPEITVVNIQKFKDDPVVVTTKDYNVDIQRIYFLDEVHRSYNPAGSFLANLEQSDQNAIKIGLTGTPILMDEEKFKKHGIDKEFSSKLLFGDYIHKYYYNASIADGYTLRLIREEIATSYRMTLQQALEEVEIEQGDIDRREVYAHEKFVEPMLDYIVRDFEESRGAMNESGIGGMVICDSANQAKQMHKIFTAKYAQQKLATTAQESEMEYSKAADVEGEYRNACENKRRVKTAAIILHDVGIKQDREDWVFDFKAGKIDLLFVYNMLLTGFDAKRLKKLYMGRVIKKHNLLQALTRVNRPYKEFRYGYVVDFADISEEFDETNKAYFAELQAELGDEMEHYSNLFKTHAEITQEIEQIKDALLHFNTQNAEKFSQQINQIEDRATILSLKKALSNARLLYNLIRYQGDHELLGKLDFHKLNQLFWETSNHLELLNLKEKLEKGSDTTNLLNAALEDVIFKFTKTGEAEMVMVNELRDSLRQTREALQDNFDQQDPKFITLKEELERLFKKKNFNEVTQQAINENSREINKIYEKTKLLNRHNNRIRDKYQGDAKFGRYHKRLWELGNITDSESQLFEVLSRVKSDADELVLKNTQMLNNESYFERTMMPLIIKRFVNESHINLDANTSRDINRLLVAEYQNEFNTGATTW